MPRPLAYEEERRLKTGHLVAALALVVLGVLIGWATDGGGGAQRSGGGRAEVGPTRTVDGVPVGYEHSREGAVAAALAYDVVLARPEFVSDARRRGRILGALATPEVARRYEREDYTALAETPVYRAARERRPLIWQTAPLGYRVGRYTEDEAQIFTWGMAITGVSGMRPQVSFVSGSGRVRWHNGDWKFAGDSGRTQDGPTPAPVEGAPRTSTEQFRARLRGLRGLRYVP